MDGGNASDRHGITSKNIVSEAVSIDNQSFQKCKYKNLECILGTYADKDIYDANKTELFFQLLPAKTLVAKTDKHQGVYYVDVAGPSPTGFYTAAVVHQDQCINGLSYRAINSAQAEEVAIALAASAPNLKVIMRDSRRACEDYLAGKGLRGNEAADAVAQALTHRAPHPGSSGSETRQPLLRFREILADYCKRHWLFPVPAKSLSGADERTLRRLQTTTLEAWEAALLNCSRPESQRALVQRVRVAAISSGVPD
ncbi:hypothetical protein HPB47_018165 [Ixodes persulcatus]|uniref:Uncharacterized protein n=1 Tax=Ixodes persulcatus TaxID=34615 RepID=A0AC60QPY8_IXOPE|nr:hypothetical protein HPB47_018165 [Ixodes persulcatus]